MSAILVEITPQGPRVCELRQQLIFFIGPSGSNTLHDMDDYARRAAEVRALAEPPDKRLMGAIGRAYGTAIAHLVLNVVQGGMRGLACPNLVVDLVESKTEGGEMLASISNPENGAACCRALIELFDADFVDVWWTGTQGHAQIECERNGTAILANNRGKREVA
jgi:hypothetical protein